MDDPLLSVRNCFVMVYEGAIRAHRGEGGGRHGAEEVHHAPALRHRHRLRAAGVVGVLKMPGGILVALRIGGCSS